MATALITGASSGIGLELARLFAADGHDLIVVARREDRLLALASYLNDRHDIAVYVLPVDLSDRTVPQHIVRELGEMQVDYLINNAGFGLAGDFAELPADRQLDMIQVNLTTLTHLTRAFLPAMIERDSGGVMNVASTAAFQPGPNMSVYYATKAFVLSLTEGIAEELADTGVNVCCLCPGPTSTEFVTGAGIENTLLFRFARSRVEPVAKAGYKGLMDGKVVAVPGWKNKIGVQALRISPRSVVRKLVKKIQS